MFRLSSTVRRAERERRFLIPLWESHLLSLFHSQPKEARQGLPSAELTFVQF